MSRHFDPGTPIYLQIAEEVRSQILAGTLGEGERLTSTTEYATRYRINPATANKAIALLVSEGLVVKHRGIGMFVAGGARERLASARRTTWADDVLRPALQAGMVLGLSPQDVAGAVARQLHDLTKGSSQIPSPTAPAASTGSPRGAASTPAHHSASTGATTSATTDARKAHRPPRDADPTDATTHLNAEEET